MTSLLRRTITVGAGITTVALTAALTAAPASAAAPTTTNPVQAAAGWLASQFENTTHLPATNGYKFTNKYGNSYYPNYGENSDAIFALAAAKAGSSKAAHALKYLRENVDAYADTSGASGGPYDGSLGKLAVTAEVLRASALNFGGVNLLQTLKNDECTTTSDSCTGGPGAAKNIFSSISESFVLIAEARAGGAYAPSDAAKSYFSSLQCSSGGYTGSTSACGAGDADIDSTSYAIMAMQAMGVTGSSLTKAETWLQGQQNKAGYWVAQGIPNTDSTGLAASALEGVGATYGKARTWLLSQQSGPGVAGGALHYDRRVTATTTSATSPAVLATAQGLVGLVDGSTLATLSAKGSTTGVRYFAPKANAYYTEHPGSTYHVYGAGFSAGETVHITRGSNNIATVKTDSLGRYNVAVTLSKYAQPGYSRYTVTGLSTQLTANHHIHIVK